MTVYEYVMNSKDVSRLKVLGLLKYKTMLYPAIYGRYLFHRETMQRTKAIMAACGDMNCSRMVGFKAVKLMEQKL